MAIYGIYDSTVYDTQLIHTIDCGLRGAVMVQWLELWTLMRRAQVRFPVSAQLRSLSKA